MKQQYLLSIKFHYKDKPTMSGYGESPVKTVTIGVYDDIKNAVKAGNDSLEILKQKGFKMHGGECFSSVNNLNVGALDKIQFIAKIETLNYYSLPEVIDETLIYMGKWLEYNGSKTIKHWLEEAKRNGYPWADKAIKNYDPGFCARKIVYSLDQALTFAFDWNTSPEKYFYWSNIREELNNNKTK